MGRPRPEGRSPDLLRHLIPLAGLLILTGACGRDTNAPGTDHARQPEIADVATAGSGVPAVSSITLVHHGLQLDDEIVARRTSHSYTFRKGNGSYLQVIGAGQVNYLDRNRDYRPIDTSITIYDGAAIAGGPIDSLSPVVVPAFANTTNSLRSYFPADPTAGVLVTVDSDEDGTGDVGVQWLPTRRVLERPGGRIAIEPIANDVLGQADGSVMRYAGTYPDTVEEYVVRTGRLKHNLILSAPPAAASLDSGSLSFEGTLLLSAGLRAHVGGVAQSGDFTTTSPIEFRDADGKPVFQFGQPQAYEQGSIRTSIPVEYRLSTDPAGVTTLALATKLAWLGDPARVYPVVIDPDVVITGDYSADSNSVTKWDADDVDCVGKIPPSTYMRSGTRFPLTSIPAGASINTLTLQVECNDAQSEGTRINRLITDPEVASAGTIHAEAASGTEYVANSPILAATGTRTQALGATAVSDVQTEVDSSGTWFAFGMKQPTEGANQYGEWRSVAWGTPAERPQLTVNYTLLPKVTQIVPFAGINTSTTAVTITGVNFTGATSVTINGSALSPMSVDSDTQITGTVLSGIAAGDWPVIVTTPEGDSTGRTVDFTVYAQGPPTVVSIIPDSGDNSGATAVTITGTNFTGATSVTINGSALSPMSVDSDTQITGTVLSGIAPGSWPVIVTTPLGTSSGNTVNFDVYSDQSDLYTKVDGTTIPDNTPAGIDSTITVPVGDDVVIKDVRVYLDITHPHVGDLIITLTSPGSTTVQIHGNQMGWMWDDIDKVWYDTVAGPSGNLDDFDGENSAGDWTLNVSDNNNVPDANDGTLNEWRLAINQLPDLTISSSDISFDNPTPTDGELVNISATVHNPSQYVHREAILTAPKNETLGGSGWPVSSAVGEAQSFVPASDVTVTGVEITIWSNVATTTASFTAQIETDSGGEPSGTAVSSQTTLSPPTMGGWLAFDFETPAQLIASTTYWIVVWSTNTENNYWDFSEGNLYPAGICAQNTGGSWSVCSGADADDDMTFRLRGRETFARFYDGDPDTNDDDIPMNNGEGATTIGADQFVANIPAFGQATAQVSWDTTGKAGAHDIFAWADPGNPAAGAIDEYSDSNNLASKSITVAAAGIPGLWTGAIDSDWGKGGNWDDGNLPDSTIDVVIPVTANDPEIDGTEPFANREVATLEIQTGAKLTMLDFDAGGDKELRVYGDVNIQSGAELIINSSGLGPRWKYLTLYGTNPTISINGTITGNGDGDGGCPDVYVRRPLTVTGSGKINAYVTINNSLANSGALTLGSDFDLNGDGEASNYSQLHIGHEAVGTGDATLFLGGFTLDVGGHVDIFGTNVTPAVPCIDMANAADIIEADGSFTNSGGGLFDEGSGLIRFTGGADQSIASETYWNVELAKTGGTVTLNGAIDVGGSLTLNGGTLDVTAANSWPITVYGNWTYNTGTFLAQSGTVTLAGGAAQSIGGTGTPSFHALYIDNSHATEVVSVDSDTTVNDALTVNDGTLQVPASQTLTIDNSGATTSTVESAATLDVEANGTLELSDDTTLQVSGELEAAGTDAGNRAVVTSTGAADRYTLIVDTNGTINASYHRFEYFDGSGIQIQGNATVISLDNGLFDYPADSGTELNVSGVAALPAQISGCIFDNTGAATSPTNVTADASTDPVDMVSFSGDLAADAVAAENTDDDPNDRVTWLKPDGYACSGDTECESTFCVDGVCCNNACGGGDTADCQACSVAQGASGDGTCEVLPNTWTCRADAGECDVAEACDGAATTCPADGFESEFTACGSSSSDECDNADSCDAGGNCLPRNVPVGTPCTDATPDDCDDARCDGTGLCDQAQDVELATYVCNADADGQCNADDTCDGVSGGACPSIFEPIGTPCGVAAPEDPECDAADTCDASGTCLENNVAAGAPCTDATPGDCDDARCDGTGLCDQARDVELNGYVCRADAGECDVAETCDGVSGGACPADGFEPEFTACGSSSSDECDAADSCDAGGNCLPRNVPVGTPCTDATPDDCDDAQCDGSGACNQAQDVELNGYVCRADAGSCDVAEACDGVSGGACPADGFAPVDTVCDTCGRCDGGGSCAYDETQDDDCGFCQECSGLGACANQMLGDDVKDECTQDACNTGTCNGSGACGFEPNTTDCGVCSICDGNGACVYDETQDLDCNICQECSALGICVNQAPGHDVKDECTHDACNTGTCDGSGACGFEPNTTDCGVCSICDGSGACVYDETQDLDCNICQECSALGLCANQLAGSDVKDECATDACHSGACDGGGNCEQELPGAECLAQSCTPGDATTPSRVDWADTCDAGGICQDNGSQSCGGYRVCNGDDCPTTCAGDGDCIDAYHCDGANVCVPDAGIGQPCGGPGDCSVGTCVDGYCCATACDGVCERCDASGSEGTCTALPDGQDPDNECDPDGCHPGTCNGFNACTQEDTGHACDLCGRCDAAGSCEYDELQDTDCPTCQECSALGSCVVQPAGSDAKDECAQDVCNTGTCDGAGACGFEPNTTDCEICGTCDGSGACVYDETQDDDCPTCQECSALATCINQASGSDTKDECAPDGCHPGHCDGNGACFQETEGHDCEICGQCDATGACVYDETQNADCPACEKCSGLGACTAQASNEDLKDDCTTDGCHPGYCNGASACAIEAEGTDCGTCAACDATGNCAVYDEDQDADCPACQECAALDTCSPVAETLDPKDDCDPDGCHPGHCDGAGACALEPADTDCGVCAACDDTGACVFDGLQDDDCGECQVCADVDSCAPQAQGEDIKDECDPDPCRPGHCDGAGACALEPVDTDCGTCAACDATGVCAYDGDQHDDCGPCLRCDGIDACVPQDDGEDIKDDCGAQTCASAGYYHGWIGDDCLFDGSSYGELCDGNGACRSAAADCDGAIAGAVATTRGACHTREGCAGILPPIPGFVPDGADDFDDCEPDAESTCGMDGLCDGSGSCRLWPAGTECAAAFCQDDTEHAPDTCDGLGVCQDGGSLPCALQACVPGSGATASYVRLGGACDGDACGEGSVQVCTGYVTCDGSVCPASCAGDDDCVDFYHCDDTSQCVPDEHLGVECTDHGECASGFCVDGYCCNSLCDGTCERCDVPGSIGACAPEPAGQDEQEACEEDACRYGYCNGAGACAMRSAWTDCGVCARCNGQGACNQYDETQDDDCPACQECSTLGACGPVAEGEDPKWDCEAGPCRSGTCDGAGACALIAEGTPCDVCATCGPLGECDRFIEFGTDPEDDCGECQVCAGSSAACVPVAAGEDPLDECEEDPAASCLRNGSCDGAGACALWSAGTECAARVCAADVLSFADICDGTGVCLDGGTLDCGAAGCVDDHCGDQLDNGEPCTGDDRCISGHCDDDVCCEVDCSGTCRACDVPGRLGQCTFHVADTDPESECNAISCTAGATRYFHGWDRGTCYYRADVTDTEADCNGSGACKPPAAECAEQGRGDSTGVYRSDCTVTTGCYGSTPGALDPVPTGTDPNGDCSASAPQTCGYDGDCDGRGSCNYWEQSTECEAARCTYGVAYEAGLCNGSGTCAAGASQFCFPYPCVGTVCGDSCTARQDCASSAHCADGACVPDECQPGVSESCGTDVGRCEKGTRTCEDGVWSACIGAVEPVQEICDNELDDDCDGFTDCLDTEDCGAEPHCLAEADADAEADAEADAGAEICEVAEGGEPPQAIARARIEDGQWSEDALEGPAVLAVTLDASLSEAGAAPIWRFRWDPGDGSTLLAGKTVVHRYWVPGSYRATVTATDCADGSNTSDPIAVTTTDPDGNRAPVVTIESIEVDGQNPLKVSAAMSVTDADGDDTVLATSWSFGEGQAAAGLQADHVYSTSGTYVLEASAVDERGLIGRDHSFVTVGGVDPAETPKVTVTADPVAGPAPLVVQLTAAIDGGWDHQLSWDFGDGSTAGPKTTTGILHTFDSPGVYHVRARATSGDRVGVGGVTVTATATDGGLPPRIISTPSLTAAAGEAYHYDDDDTVEVSGSLVDLEFSLGKEISGTLINQPVGMEIHPTTGSITWVPSRSQVREPQRVTVVVRNSHGSDFQDWTVTVTGSPPPADDCGCGGGGGGNAAGGLLLLLAAALGWRRRKR